MSAGKTMKALVLKQHGELEELVVLDDYPRPEAITALTAHYITNRYTFEAIFSKRPMTPKRIQQRLDHAAEMILRYVQVSRGPTTPTPIDRMRAAGS
jgi:tetracycline repressor-like protein